MEDLRSHGTEQEPAEETADSRKAGDVPGERLAVERAGLAFRHLAAGARRATVSGAPGFVVFNRERPYAVLAFAFGAKGITEIDVLGDPERLARLDLSAVRA